MLAVVAAGLSEDQRKLLREGVAENVKRVKVLGDEVDWFDAVACAGPWWIESVVEMKTMWHPSGV